MAQPATHIVHKLNLEIEAASESQARHLYSQAGSIMQQYVLPKLEELLRQYTEEEMHIRLETLNIDLQAAPGTSLEGLLKEQLAGAIGKQLEEVLQKASDDEEREGSIIKRRTGPRQIVEAFFIFLETGTLPWWIADTEAFSRSQQIVDAIAQQEEHFVALFLEKVTERPVLLQRVLLQYDAVLLTYLFSLLVPVEILKTALAFEQHWTADVEPDKEQFRQKYWALIWSLAPVKALQTITKEVFQTHLEATIRLAGEKDPVFGRLAASISRQVLAADKLVTDVIKSKNETSTEKTGQNKANIIGQQETVTESQADARRTGKEHSSENDNSGIKEEKTPVADTEALVTRDGLLVDNAGLILLHPFLQHFFKELGLLEGQQFRDVGQDEEHQEVRSKRETADKRMKEKGQTTHPGEKENKKQGPEEGEDKHDRDPEAKSEENIRNATAEEKMRAANAGDEVTQQGFWVKNAGLILLHPFQQYFFKELGLLEGEQLQKPKDIAVHLLHYLATGKEHAADFELVFEKYLCGLKPEQTTYRYTRLTDKMKTEAGALLSSVIKHWQVLKNTSASGLQESFLQRKGKLMIKTDSHKLIMEHNTLDILLAQLPWNISLVKLPWIEQMIHVEWVV